jgi:hypothetical protein
MPGYSGTPLAKKLGIKAGTTLVVHRAPADYQALLAPVPPGVIIEQRTAGPAVDMFHFFATSKTELSSLLRKTTARTRADAVIWVSWPKKSSKVETDITEDTIRELAFPLDLVDIKVCAVSDVWSALKLVIRKERRPRNASGV